MKRFIIAVILMFVPMMVNAEVYVLYDPVTNEIKSAIHKDDAVLEPGWEKVILPGKLKDYGLTKHPKYYKFIDGDFIQDNDKITKENEGKKKQNDYSDEMLMISNKILKDACEALEAEGVKFKEIKCSDFEQ